MVLVLTRIWVDTRRAPNATNWKIGQRLAKEGLCSHIVIALEEVFERWGVKGRTYHHQLLAKLHSHSEVADKSELDRSSNASLWARRERANPPGETCHYQRTDTKPREEHRLGSGFEPTHSCPSFTGRNSRALIVELFGHARSGVHDRTDQMAVTVESTHSSWFPGKRTVCTLTSETMLGDTCRTRRRNWAGIRYQAHRSISGERRYAWERSDGKAALDMDEAEFSANLLALWHQTGFGLYIGTK